jgi:hypothetical protein
MARRLDDVLPGEVGDKAAEADDREEETGVEDDEADL